jgi:hypothetical protein
VQEVASASVVKIRAIHKYLGIVLLLPFIAWSATAVFFLVRPAFTEAYARLDVKQYPLDAPLTLAAHPQWQELRYVHSILGEHLLVRQDGQWRHLDPQSLQELPYPDNDKLRLLLADAITSNPERYGNIALLDGRRISTDTGVNIQLDWNTLGFTQEGRDTRWIDRIYRIHYLEWTGIYLVDRFLGLFGLFLLMFMTYTGARMVFGRDSVRKPDDAVRNARVSEPGMR